MKSIVSRGGTGASSELDGASYDSHAEILISNSQNSTGSYQLSRKAIADLLYSKPVCDEIINAYIRLLASERCNSKENKEEEMPESAAKMSKAKNNFEMTKLHVKIPLLKKSQYQFHLFDTLFFRHLTYLFEAQRYDFIEFSSFFDKHFQSQKKLTDQSIIIFVVPVEAACLKSHQKVNDGVHYTLVVATVAN